MSIIERTELLHLTQYSGSSLMAQFVLNYNEDMRKIDGHFSDYESELNQRVSDLGDTVSVCMDKVENMDDRIVTLETCCSDVNTTLNNYGSRLIEIERVIDTVSTANIDDLTERVNALENKVEANASNINTVKVDISDLKDRMSSVETKQSEDAQQIARNTGRIVILEDCCSEVRDTLTALDARITTNASDIATLTERVAHDEGNIAANAQDITILSGQVATNSADIEDLKSAFDELDPTSQFELVRQVSINTEAIGNLQVITGNHTTSINALNGRMDLVDDEVADLTARVIQVESDISQVQNWETRISALESGLAITDGKVDDALDYIGDWSTYRTSISDANATIAGRVSAFDTHFGTIDSEIGDLTNLATTAKNDLVSAINEVNALVGTASGDLTSLTARVGVNETNIGLLQTRMRTAEGNITSIGDRVTAIETLDGNTTMTTTAQTLTGAIEEVNVASANVKSRVDGIDGIIGDWANSSYSASDVVTEFGRVDTSLGTLDNEIGTLSNLTTSVQTDLVSAVNEVDAHADTNATNIGDLTQLNTTDKSSLVSAINEVISSVGLTAIQNALHPVGSVYLTIGNTNPATLLGFGTWSQLADGYLRNGASLASATGGSLTSGSHVLTVAEMPSHSHSLSNHTHDWSNTHAHGITQTNHSHGGSFGTSEGNRGGSYGSVPVGYTTSTNGAKANITINNETISGTTGAPSTNTTDSKGSDNGHTHSIEPTYTRVYAWERTA